MMPNQDARSRRTPSRTTTARLLAAFACVATLAGSATALAASGPNARSFFSPPHKPAGVPDDYVLTRNGLFHPSCVITLENDESVGRDLVVRGPDGSEHFTITPCAHPRFSRTGLKIEPVDIVVPQPAPEMTPAHHSHRPHDTYDGWILWYEYDGGYDSSVPLSHTWIVPQLPTNIGTQDIAFFNDIETTAGGDGDILQPVLDMSEIPGQWAIESEHCCIANNDMQSNLVQVSPGDVIRGDVVGSGCAGDGSCASWTVTTTDLNTEENTILNTTAPGGVPEMVHSAVLETYDVTSCDMLPANGEFDATDINPNPLGYQLEGFASEGEQMPAGFPTTCGYNGQSGGSQYTLFFSNSPTPVQPNQSTSASSSSVTSGAGGTNVSSVASSAVSSSVTVGAGGANTTVTSSSGVFTGTTTGGDDSSDDDPGFGASKSACGCGVPGDRSTGDLLAMSLAALGLVLASSRRRRR